MTSPIKLVALDLDGTLLNSDSDLEYRAKEAVRRVQEKGVKVTLATGRMFRSALPFARELNLKLPLIVYHGALIKNPVSGEVMREKLLPLSIVEFLVGRAREYGFPYNVYVEDELYVDDIQPENLAYADKARVPLHKVDDILGFLKEKAPKEPIKFVALHDGPKLDRLEEEVRKAIGHRVYITRSFPYFLEVISREASKAKGLEILARHLGISPKEIMVIGDSFNDLDMFHFAGLAVAMGNAPPAVRAQAHYVVATNDEGGVAEALTKFILER
ncbi:MAG: Cof-type HAD-IIB family hydrolase [Thermanaeromonas sp.]|uniref:Cof-type HAD-IIB family hydrolase n=1 Tax=Thermanaeromonas sp. TaxID=2003697 RepID=UPI00243ADC9D|nr:Cof-type HAD-IIB family hydrolase [Thermanaeromonas sp.]MCG0277453.1 Cof-type HAD-IIB family hydrolase [Thermanaeromonas sp.]